MKVETKLQLYATESNDDSIMLIIKSRLCKEKINK